MPIVFRKAEKKAKDAATILARLKAADHAYYNKSKPIMSDAQYDKLRELAEQAAKKTGDKALKAYLKQVGAPIRESKRSEKLPIELGSLKKVKSDDDKALFAFVRKAQQATIEHGNNLAKKGKSYEKVAAVWRRGSVTLHTSPKLDGLTLLLHYQNGKLKNAYSRGDGKNAQSKLSHAQALVALGRLPSVLPKSAFHKFARPDIYVKGEIVCSLKAFREKWQGKGYTNARNAASGWLNSDKAEHPIHNAMQFLAYDVFTDKGELGIDVDVTDSFEGPSASKLHTLTSLKRAGFKTYLKSGFFTTFTISGTPSADWVAQVKGMLSKLNDSPFQLDGIVIEVGSSHVRSILGTSDNRPRYAIAYKTSADDLDNNEGADTTITKVEYNTSKTGALKPTLHYKPVNVMDSTLSKATGNNVSYLLKHGIGVGAKVRVVKAGGIIPKVHLTGPKVKADAIVPTKCECGAKAIEVKKNGKVLPDWYCSKPDKCKVIQREIFAASIKRLKIVGVSGKTVDKLFDAGYHSIGELLGTSPKKIMQIPGFGQAAAASLTAGVEKAVTNSSRAELMEMSGVFMEPGLALASESFEKLAKALGKDMKLDKSKVLKAIGPAKGKLFIEKYPAWVAYKKEHLSEFV